MAESAEFDRWLHEMSPESFEDGALLDDDWLGWLRHLYDREGPLPRDAVMARGGALLEGLLAAAPWGRIADDLLATTGRNLVLIPRRDADGSGHGSPEFEVILDGNLIGAFHHGFSPNAEVFVAEVADYLCGFALDEEVWGGWPICPDHGTHPLTAEVVHGVASWRCPAGRAVAPIGSLAPNA